MVRSRPAVVRPRLQQQARPERTLSKGPPSVIPGSTDSGQSQSHPVEEATFDRLYCIGKSLEYQGLSGSAQDLVAGSWRSGTNKAYSLAWGKWSLWCRQQQVNRELPTEKDIVNYLISLHSEGKSYSVLNTHRSMLSQTLQLICGRSFDSIIITRVMIGLFNSNPPKPKYCVTWDVSVVLAYIRTLYPLVPLSLKDLTFRLVMLLALTTAQRAQTLISMNLDYMQPLTDGCVFHIVTLLKTSGPGRSQPSVVVKKYVNAELCVYRTLMHYITVTQSLRKTRQLLISYVTFRAVSTATLARWIRSVLASAGISDVFRAHSTRSASTSAAFHAGVPLRDIFQAANWTNSNTFAAFYKRDIVDSDSQFANAVLGKGH